MLSNLIISAMKMLNLLLIIGGLAGCGAALMKYLGEVSRESEKEALQKRFDDWWRTLSNTDNYTFALALAKQLSQWFDSCFGVRLISKRAFVQSSKLSFLLFVLGLGFTGIHNGRAIGLAPWASYQKAMSVSARYKALATPCPPSFSISDFRINSTGMEANDHTAGVVTISLRSRATSSALGFSCSASSKNRSKTSLVL